MVCRILIERQLQQLQVWWDLIKVENWEACSVHVLKIKNDCLSKKFLTKERQTMLPNSVTFGHNLRNDMCFIFALLIVPSKNMLDL